MSKYELNSKQIALISQSLLNHGCFYECEDKEYQNIVKKEAQEIMNSILEQHNKQEKETLKYYPCYK